MTDLNFIWHPTQKEIESTHIYKAMQAFGFTDYADFHRFSYENFSTFWQYTIEQLAIHFDKPYTSILQSKEDLTKPNWLYEANFNIVDSCFDKESSKPAIIYRNESGEDTTLSYQDLHLLVNQIANSLVQKNILPKDYVAIYMPMNIEAVAIYLAIIKIGAIVVSIPSSFASDEIATRLNITNPKLLFTQSETFRDGKSLKLYQKCKIENFPNMIVLDKNKKTDLRAQDIYFSDFLLTNNSHETVIRNPNDQLNILFSSGTTGEPKAIVWQQVTPIKCASDAYYHHDIKPNDIFAWPSDLGWMMGPWLIFATLLNRATLALFEGSPTSKKFGEFIQDKKITMLGLVPSIVSHWKTNQSMEAFDWSAIKLFSSSGECSNPEDMSYLMQLGKGKPVIEYCGGTEIAGAYITSCLLYPNIPATFNTPTLGLNFILLNEEGALTNNGEVAIVAPSIGLSNILLNRDNQEIYYQGMPTINGLTLRRHGDQIEKIDEIYFRALGRVDDTMNLGGIKVSSAEIERVLHEVDGIKETAAIAVNPKSGGPSLLVIYAVCTNENEEKNHLKTNMQNIIKQKLNPLFKIHDVVFVTQLPRTASNKIMRRTLREKYMLAGF